MQVYGGSNEFLSHVQTGSTCDPSASWQGKVDVALWEGFGRCGD